MTSPFWMGLLAGFCLAPLVLLLLAALFAFAFDPKYTQPTEDDTI